MFSSKSKGYELLSANENFNDEQHQTQPRAGRRWTTTTMLAALVLSLVLNALLLGCTLQLKFSFRSQPGSSQDRSRYASLERNIPVSMTLDTPYATHDFTEARKLWEDISIDDGMVALPDAFVAEKGLPEAQRFPWDSGKGLYFLNGYHNLHCLRSVHIALMEFHFGEPQSRRFEHVLHCMESLRQDIICNADDTPRYTTISKDPESGVGQARMCRDWSQLERWARGYNSCFAFVNQTATGFPQVLRYTHCPEGSPYVDVIKETFGTSEVDHLETLVV